MSDKYMAEEFGSVAACLTHMGHTTATKMLRQAAQMMREREVGGAVTDEDVNKAVEAAEKWADENGFVRYMAPSGYTRAALESFAARRAAVPDVATWTWCWLMEYCKAQGASPASMDRLFKLVSDMRAMLAAAPEVTK